MGIPKEPERKLETYLITAGHCILGATNKPWYSSTPKGAETEKIGEQTQLVLGEAGDYGDIQIENPGFWVEAGATPVYAGVMRWATGQEKASQVMGEEASFEGLENCRQGGSSNEQCGEVTALNQEVTYKVGAKLVTAKGLVRDFACGEGGDSGGPWLSMNKAGELLVNGTEVTGPPEKCEGHTCLLVECRSDYEPIKTSLEGLGLELLKKSNEERTKQGPLIEVLPGEKASELKFEGKAGGSKLETTGGKTISCTAAKATAKFTATGVEANSEKGEATVDLEGCKKEKVACRSENSKGEKDPVEVVLAPLGLTDASEETAAKELQFVWVATFKETLLINCGVVKNEVKGNVGCLVKPALTEVAAGGTVTFACAVEAKGKQKTGKCVATKATCEKLEKEPLSANLGVGFEGAAAEITIEGSFGKMVTLDD